MVDKEPIIYKCIACNGIVAGRGDVDATPVVVNIVACNGVIVAVTVEVDAVTVVAGSVVCNAVAARIVEVDTVKINVADIII